MLYQNNVTFLWNILPKRSNYLIAKLSQNNIPLEKLTKTYYIKIILHLKVV